MVGGEAGVTGGAESQKLDFIFWVDEALLMLPGDYRGGHMVGLFWRE